VEAEEEASTLEEAGLALLAKVPADGVVSGDEIDWVGAGVQASRRKETTQRSWKRISPIMSTLVAPLTR
jgi:hypothetical protein